MPADQPTPEAADESPSEVGPPAREPMPGWVVRAIVIFWLVLSLRAQTLDIKEGVVLFFLMGAITGGWLAVLWALIREITPAEGMGFIAGVMNPAPFFGIAVFQVLTGAVLDHVGRIDGVYPPEAFQAAFWVCTLAAVVCLMLSLIIKNKRVSRSVPGNN